jgi:hypothetical protein
LQAVRQSKLGAPLVSRALAILHTCMFDAAAAYHDRAVATASGGRGRRPPVERTLSNRRIAISEAAYVAFAELFPHHRRFADEQMARRGLTPRARAAYLTPSDVGRAACAAVLRARHRDGANQLGDENGGAPYSDYTRYRPTNTLVRLSDQRHWQPVASSNLGPSAFLVPHWGRVPPFLVVASAGAAPAAERAIRGRGGRRACHVGRAHRRAQGDRRVLDGRATQRDTAGALEPLRPGRLAA